MFFDSLKQDFVNINKEVEYIIKKQHDILHFNWPDDTLFDKWLADMSPNELLDKAKIDDDDVHEDEVQVIDTPEQDQRKEEDKRKQPILVVGSEAQDASMIEEETRIKIVLLVHDENI